MSWNIAQKKNLKKKDRKIIGSIHPWAFSVLVDFRILQSADRRWIRADGGSSKTGFIYHHGSQRHRTAMVYPDVMVFSVLLIWVRRVEKDRLWKLGEKANVPFLVLFAIVIWGAAQILNTPMIVVYRFGIYGVGFFVGYFVLSHDEVMDRLEKCWSPLAVCAVILACAFTVLYWGRPYAEHSVLDTPLCDLFAWIAVIATLAFMKKWGIFPTHLQDGWRRNPGDFIYFITSLLR